MNHLHHARIPGQRGAVLIVALIMLVLITLVSLSSVRTSTLDEKMAGNARDRDKAMQAADAAVRWCLQQVKAKTYPAASTLTPAAAAASQVWEVPASWANTNSTQVDFTLTNTGLTASPRCMVELLDATTNSYRITGRAQGGSASTIVMLQATYTEAP